MAVALRLSRGGSKKRPFYRIVAADVRSPRDGKFIERLGTYNPMRSKDDPERVLIKKERVSYWLSVGAKPTNRVAKFLANEGIMDKLKIYPQTKKDKPSAKTLEKLKAKEEKVKNKNLKPESSIEAKVTEEKPAEPVVESKATEEKPAEPVAEAKVTEEKPAEPVAEAKVTEEKPAEPVAESKATEEKPAEPIAEAKVTEEKPAEPVAKEKDENFSKT